MVSGRGTAVRTAKRWCTCRGAQIDFTPSELLQDLVLGEAWGLKTSMHSAPKTPYNKVPENFSLQKADKSTIIEIFPSLCSTTPPIYKIVREPTFLTFPTVLLSPYPPPPTTHQPLVAAAICSHCMPSPAPTVVARGQIKPPRLFRPKNISFLNKPPLKNKMEPLLTQLFFLPLPHPQPLQISQTPF